MSELDYRWKRMTITVVDPPDFPEQSGKPRNKKQMIKIPPEVVGKVENERFGFVLEPLPNPIQQGEGVEPLRYRAMVRRQGFRTECSGTTGQEAADKLAELIK